MRLCCHATTISYEGSAITWMLSMALTVLRELLARFGDVRDDDDRAKLYLEQYVVQVGVMGVCEAQVVSAVRRVMSPNCGVRGMAASGNICRAMASHSRADSPNICLARSAAMWP